MSRDRASCRAHVIERMLEKMMRKISSISKLYIFKTGWKAKANTYQKFLNSHVRLSLTHHLCYPIPKRDYLIDLTEAGELGELEEPGGAGGAGGSCGALTFIVLNRAKTFSFVFFSTPKYGIDKLTPSIRQDG